MYSHRVADPVGPGSDLQEKNKIRNRSARVNRIRIWILSNYDHQAGTGFEFV